MGSELLKQIVESNKAALEQILYTTHMNLYTAESSTCSIEPCLNYQQCLAQTRFHSAAANYQGNGGEGGGGVQFRSIRVQHDFACRCPLGFTGTNTSVTCDLEINLCYSNPCRERGGRCVSVESGYVCVCEPGWTGRACEYNLAEAKCCGDDVASSPILVATSSSPLRITNAFDKTRFVFNQTQFSYITHFTLHTHFA